MREIALSFIAVAYLLYNAVWMLPESPTRSVIVSPLKSFWLFWGLEQNWKLFSPKIRGINYHPVGIITFADGFKEIWEPPRMDKLDFLTRMRKDAFRKWVIDSLPWPDHQQFWPDIARFIGREHFREGNPPTEFSLLLFWTNVPPPERPATREDLPVHSTVNHVFTYRFKPGELN